MVCVRDPYSLVNNTIKGATKKQALIQLTPTRTIDTIFLEIASEFSLNISELELTLTMPSGKVVNLNEHMHQTLGDIGVSCVPAVDHCITIRQRDGQEAEYNAQNEAMMGTYNDYMSTSPKNDYSNETGKNQREKRASRRRERENDYRVVSYSDANTVSMDTSGASNDEAGGHSSTTEPVHYVGLVNQAMTCYLNSLLQALYMTPEFRNALYKWEFDGQNASRSIPFQLQKLFLNLQTSAKSAVETTDLTTSFGWQGSDAWQQHDIQELCRVMFDALEQKFQATEQANLINDLYEGKMLDYVKCLECGTEKSREDTFLDIPLPVRPFGSTVAYNSIEEALGAFVQPETLDGNNQYHCEKCNKKCDAHKGLKFTKFPYLLTLHLKRFDFDYNTMKRIKLNDKVVFPEKLNLNSFISDSRNETIEDREHTVKCDDCSTTDSGSALDDESCHGTDASSTINGQDDNCGDSDEGIDLSSNNNHENEPKGPYVYELFSIMIHFGSASGGHYFAYIKDFDKNQWFCFNDQTVTRITDEDIKKTYGGGLQRGYYSGAYSSSTNAYMLMYRQIDKERNCKAITVEEFPPHIQNLLTNMRLQEEQDRINREKESDRIKLNVYCHHPVDEVLRDTRLPLYLDSTLAEAASYAHSRFKLMGVVSAEDCRLVRYYKMPDRIDCSFESDQIKFCDIACPNSLMQSDWLLEIKSPGTSFEVFKTGGITVRVYSVNMTTDQLEATAIVRINPKDTVRDLKAKVTAKLPLVGENLYFVMQSGYSEFHSYHNDDEVITFDEHYLDHTLFAANIIEDPDKLFENLRLYHIAEKYRDIVTVSVLLPAVDPVILDVLSIPSLDLNKNLDQLELAAGDKSSFCSLQGSCAASGDGQTTPEVLDTILPSKTLDKLDLASGDKTFSSNFFARPGSTGDGFGDQSNSEDSSLSDSDRTLVGDAPGECMGLLSSSSNSPGDQHMASPSDPAEDSYNYDVLGNPREVVKSWGFEESDEHARQNQENSDDHYFRIMGVGSCKVSDNSTETTFDRSCAIFVDRRMTLEKFKKHLECLVGVPSEYFKVFRQLDIELRNLEDHLCKKVEDGDKLLVKLGRVLKKDEWNWKVHLYDPDNSEQPVRFLFEHVICKGASVGQVKKEIMFKAKKMHMLDFTYEKCRLRKMGWKKPTTVYLDDLKFDADLIDFAIYSSFELFIQALPEPEKVTSVDQIVLLVKQWHPADLSFGPSQEVVLDSPADFTTKVSELSNVPSENLEAAHVKAKFPSDIHLLDVENDLEWTNADNIAKCSSLVESGNIFFYRDNREPAKELTTEEKNEINQRENKRLGRSTAKKYSFGRERGLKIYLDTSPCKSNDNYTD